MNLDHWEFGSVRGCFECSLVWDGDVGLVWVGVVGSVLLGGGFGSGGVSPSLLLSSFVGLGIGVLLRLLLLGFLSRLESCVGFGPLFSAVSVLLGSDSIFVLLVSSQLLSLRLLGELPGLSVGGGSGVLLLGGSSLSLDEVFGILLQLGLLEGVLLGGLGLIGGLEASLLGDLVVISFLLCVVIVGSLSFGFIGILKSGKVGIGNAVISSLGGVIFSSLGGDVGISLGVISSLLLLSSLCILGISSLLLLSVFSFVLTLDFEILSFHCFDSGISFFPHLVIGLPLFLGFGLLLQDV